MTSPLLLVLFASACATDDPAPSVSIVMASPQTLVLANDLADDLRIVVTYTDDDGDLGGGVARTHDCRAESLVTELAIPAIAPPNVIGEKITGSLDLALDDVGAAAASTLPPVCVDARVAPLATDTTVFCVVLVDAKGNASSPACTNEIALAP